MHHNLLQEVKRIVESDGRPSGKGINLLARSEDGAIRIGYAGHPSTKRFERIRSAFDLDAYADDMFPSIPPFVFERSAALPQVKRVTVAWPSLQLAIVEVEPDTDVWTPAPPSADAPIGVSPDEIVEAIAAFRLPTWSLAIDPESKPRPAGSRFFGRPWLPTGTPVPVDAAGSSLSLLLQLDLGHMPEDVQVFAGDKGLISVFVSSGGGTVAVLRIDSTVKGGLAGDEARPAACLRLTGPVDDHLHVEDVVGGGMGLPGLVVRAVDERLLPPGGEDRRRFGSVLNQEDVDAYRRSFDQLFGAESLQQADAYANLVSHAGTKIGGWPAWEQGGEWPDADPGSHRLLLQIDGEDHEAFPGGVIMVFVDLRDGSLVAGRQFD